MPNQNNNRHSETGGLLVSEDLLEIKGCLMGKSMNLHLKQLLFFFFSFGLFSLRDIAYVFMCVCVCVNHSVVSDSLQPHGL